MKKILLAIFVIFLIGTTYIISNTGYFAGFIPTKETHLGLINLPQGFIIEEYATAEGARSLELTENNILFVGTRGIGKVYAIKDKKTITIADNLNSPNGVAFSGGNLYVAEINRIIKFPDIENNLEFPKYETVTQNYPDNQWHGWKFIRIGPDNKLYVPVGAPCNVCEVEDPFASITRIDLDGQNQEIVARGIRNTVGFDWHPDTNELWFTDNGRDLLGEDIPPDELNHLKDNTHFGFPYCHGKGIEDPDYQKDCEVYEKPVVELGPHIAALGMRFYKSNNFPEKYHKGIFIAEHGSWNRKVPIGYRITFVNPLTKTYEIFADGWLQGNTAWGRPVDIEEMADGSLLVSDDKAGMIYKISHPKN